ncbi:MAG TPA: hypothetical protein VG860_04060 [Terriglobia bacterium]|nr:hypothetical protein [Terriglobia bacterium]
MNRNEIEEIKRLLDGCTDDQRAEIFTYLRPYCHMHPLEAKLGVPAETILEAIARGSDLTLRGVKGMIAELSFKTHVLDKLQQWTYQPLVGDYPYDFLVDDGAGAVKLQVKMQRSEKQAPSRYKSGMYKVEVQKTRGGVDKLTKEKTRPYRFGEFDVLVVSLHASTGRWDSFLYTVSRWLIPSKSDPRIIQTFQPVGAARNSDWTDNLDAAVGWFRSDIRKTICTE